MKTIKEISGFDDSEEDVAVNENEAASNQIGEEDIQSTKEESESDDSEQAEQAEQVETEVTTTETTVNNQQDTQEMQQTTASQSKNDGVIQHVVQSNENLFRIALKYYSSAEGVEIIKQYNGLKGNDIVTGQVLKIPPR